MPEQEPQFEERKPLHTTWDVLSNQSYTEKGWEKLIEKRMAKYQEALQQNAYDDAARLLLKGGLKEKLGPEEIADFAGQYFDYYMSEYRRLRDPQEFRKFVDEEYDGSPAIDQILTVQRSLELAMSVYRAFGEFVSSQQQDELQRLSREAAKPLFDLLQQHEKFLDILKWPETQALLDQLPPEEARRIATEGIKQYLADDPRLRRGKKLDERTRAILAGWAAKYGVEDEDILEALTGPGN